MGESDAGEITGISQIVSLWLLKLFGQFGINLQFVLAYTLLQKSLEAAFYPLGEHHVEVKNLGSSIKSKSKKDVKSHLKNAPTSAYSVEETTL